MFVLLAGFLEFPNKAVTFLLILQHCLDLAIVLIEIEAGRHSLGLGALILVLAVVIGAGGGLAGLPVVRPRAQFAMLVRDVDREFGWECLRVIVLLPLGRMDFEYHILVLVRCRVILRWVWGRGIWFFNERCFLVHFCQRKLYSDFYKNYIYLNLT